MARSSIVFLAVLSLAVSLASAKGMSGARAEQYVALLREAVEKVNRKHLAAPKDSTEADLGKQLPRGMLKKLDLLLGMDDGDPKWEALAGFIAAAAELDLKDEIAKAEKALRKGSPAHAAKAGHYISRPRFLLHALRVEDSFAEEFARAFEGVLETYDRVFGFVEFSKVPGKKIRVELHQEASPRPPHFAPQYPFHSAVDFPVAKGGEFRSPTPDGKFHFYGLCHELGHLIAMWGDRRTEDDHHAWAHYTGVVVVDASAKKPFAKHLRDQRWRSLEKDRKRLEAVAPSGKDRDGVLKLLISLHDLVGPKRIGAALNLMDEKRMGHRINQVRYYWLKDLEKALLAGSKSSAEKKKIAKLFA